MYNFVFYLTNAYMDLYTDLVDDDVFIREFIIFLVHNKILFTYTKVS